jgi:hypothetical protein
MGYLNLAFQNVLFILYIVTFIIIWLTVSRILKRYNSYTLQMKKDGSYSAWAMENKALLFFARLFKYVAILCFVSLIFLSIFEILKNVMILFELTFSFLLISIALYLILYLKLPNNQTKI